MAGLDRPFTVDLRGLGDGRQEVILAEAGPRLGLPDGELAADSEVSLELTLSATGSLITAHGVVRTSTSLTCARCLEPYDQEIEADFDIVIRRGKSGLMLEDEADSSIAFGDEWIAFDVPVREAVILSMPMKPLCEEDCQGLCTVCGTNLNRETCTCQREPADARWDELKTLLDQD
jgi:uncharacterized protein